MGQIQWGLVDHAEGWILALGELALWEGSQKGRDGIGFRCSRAPSGLEEMLIQCLPSISLCPPSSGL